MSGHGDRVLAALTGEAVGYVHRRHVPATVQFNGNRSVLWRWERPHSGWRYWARRRLVTPDPAEAYEALMSRGLVPEDPLGLRSFGCRQCAGIGAVSNVRSGVTACSLCEGRGYRATPEYQALYRWARMGVAQILQAEELAAEVVEGLREYGATALTAITWERWKRLSIDPRTPYEYRLPIWNSPRQFEGKSVSLLRGGELRVLEGSYRQHAGVALGRLRPLVDLEALGVALNLYDRGVISLTTPELGGPERPLGPTP